MKMFIGDGAKLVRDAFELAKEKCKDQHKVSCVQFFKICRRFAFLVAISAFHLEWEESYLPCMVC